VAVAVDEPRRHERVRGVERFVGVAREIGADLEDFATFLIDQYVGSRHRQIGTEDLPAGNRQSVVIGAGFSSGGLSLSMATRETSRGLYALFRKYMTMNERTQRERDRSTGGYPPREALADAWDEHSRYVGFAAGLFVIGILIGIALMAAGYNLLEIIEEMVGEPLFPDIGGQSRTELARFLLVNNTRAFLLSILGALTLGLPDGLGDGVQRNHCRESRRVHRQQRRHRLHPRRPPSTRNLRTPALFIGAGVGFRLLYRVGQRLRGSRDAILTKRYFYRTGLLVLAGWLLLVVAAVVEAFVTPALLEALFAA